MAPKRSNTNRNEARDGDAAAAASSEDDAAKMPEIPRLPPMSAIKMAHSAAPAGTRDRDEALRCFTEALEHNPHDSFTYHKLGLLYDEEYRDRDRAKECFERAVEINPRNAPAYNSLGLMYKGKNNVLAVELFKTSISVDAEYGRAHKNLGLLYLNELNDHVRARECFMECLRVDPNNSSAYVAMGQMCERQKEYKAAEAYYHMSIQSDSRNPIGYFRLGVLKESRKEFKEAKQQFELAVRANPSDIRFLVKLAKLAEKEPFRDFYLARKCYRTAVKHNPEVGWLPGRIKFIEDRMLERGEDRKPVILPEHEELFEEDTEATPLGSAIEMSRQGSSGSTGANPPAKCPRRHTLLRISAKPLTYKPQATWACEECHKSIGGLDLRVNGALHCPICKYDLCSTCALKPKTAHVLPEEPTLIGHGAYGEVFREYDPATESYVAVKYVRTPRPKDVQAVQREVRLMRLFDASPYIVKVLRFEHQKHRCLIYLELMAGSVASVIERTGPVHETQARLWVYGALCGLATLHNANRPVLHRDIKPENLLLTADGEVKLSDFGISKNVGGATAATAGATAGPKGTPQFVAPECYNDPPNFTYACDIWSLGCTWLSMVTGRHPWHGVLEGAWRFEQIAYRLMEQPNIVPKVPDHLTPEAQDLLRRMLDRDRRKRPTAEMILADDYFARTDLLERAESVKLYEERRDSYLAERGPMDSEGHAGETHQSGVLVDGVSLMTPATPTALIEPGGGLFPAIDTASVIAAAPPSVHSWGSVTDLETAASPTMPRAPSTIALHQSRSATSVFTVDVSVMPSSNGTLTSTAKMPQLPRGKPPGKTVSSPHGTPSPEPFRSPSSVGASTPKMPARRIASWQRHMQQSIADTPDGNNATGSSASAPLATCQPQLQPPDRATVLMPSDRESSSPTRNATAVTIPVGRDGQDDVRAHPLGRGRGLGTRLALGAVAATSLVAVFVAFGG